MKAGYVRGVYSSAEVQRILHAFDAASCGEVVINARPQNNHLFVRLLEKLVPGDTLTVWNLDCAAAGAGELAELITGLNGRRIGFEAIVEGLVVPSSPVLSRSRILAAIDSIRSPGRQPARPTRRRAAGGGLAAAPEAAALLAAPAR